MLPNVRIMSCQDQDITESPSWTEVCRDKFNNRLHQRHYVVVLVGGSVSWNTLSVFGWKKQ